MLKLLRIPETPLLSAVSTFCPSGRHNAHHAGISRMKRTKYVRQYYVTLLQPDGSTVLIRANEPKDLIQMPFNIDALTDEERHQFEMKRHKTKKPTKNLEVVKFNADEYVDLWRKNSKSRK